MLGLVFWGVSMLLVAVMMALFLIISVTCLNETSSKAPLESGFSTTGEVLKAFSLQFFVVLVLFLVFDLEVVFVVALVFSGSVGSLSKSFLVVLIVLSLWAEWSWGKLFWAV